MRTKRTRNSAALSDLGNSRTVRTLLVNDCPKMLKALSQILTREGFMVVGSATNGCQALRYASTLAPELVLMGLHLSRVNGTEVTKHLKRSLHPPLVFLVASDDSPTSRAMSDAAGADAFVSASSDLEAQLKSTLQQRFHSMHHEAAKPAKLGPNLFYSWLHSTPPIRDNSIRRSGLKIRTLRASLAIRGNTARHDISRRLCLALPELTVRHVGQ